MNEANIGYGTGPPKRGWAARLVAGLVALTAWAGLAVQFEVLSTGPASWPATAWTMLGYFTIITNVLVAVVFTAFALSFEPSDRPGLLGATTLSILLVGIVYGLLLHGLRELSGGSVLANALLHYATPVLAPLFWLVFVHKGALTWRDPLIWVLYPFGYFLYALLRGGIEGRYVYPFIDVLGIGWPQTLLNGAVIAAGFLVAGAAMVWLDRRLARRRKLSSIRSR